MLDTYMDIQAVSILVFFTTFYALKLVEIEFIIFSSRPCIDRLHHPFSQQINILRLKRKYLNVIYFSGDFLYPFSVILETFDGYDIRHVWFPELVIIIIVRIIQRRYLFSAVYTVKLGAAFFIKVFQFWQYFGLKLCYPIIKLSLMQIWCFLSLPVLFRHFIWYFIWYWSDN